MFYQTQIKYIGDPIKAILDSGMYLWTTIAEDVPVTHYKINHFLAMFRFSVMPEASVKNLDVQVFFEDCGNERFIGESVLIYDLLIAMIGNSRQAGAKVFSITARTTADRVFFTVSDNGSGIKPEYAHVILNEGFTTKPHTSGFTLYFAALNMKKIGSAVKYLGANPEGTGAVFEVSFLKEMPAV